jgi:hypothetical protein
MPAAPKGAKPGAKKGRSATPTQGLSQLLPARMGRAESTAEAQSQLEASEFDAETTQFDALVGRKRAEEDSDEPTVSGFEFSGETPAAGLDAQDTWKAVQPPVQSREGRRSGRLYQLVIDQFAVGANPRYERSGAGPLGQRGHVFAWDVGRAMNVEIPYFQGMRELSVAHVIDWLRNEAPLKGWRRTRDDDEALAAANQGQLVLAVPRDLRVRQIAVVRPGELGADGKPQLAAAGATRGNRLTVVEALGVVQAEYYLHA